MIPRVDWISYTVPIGISPIPIGPTYAQRTLNRAIEESPDPIAEIVGAAEWETKPGKNFYRHRLQRVGGGCDVFSSPDRDDALIELSGVGCAMFPAESHVIGTIREVRPRLTRLDLAADFLDPASPFEFIHRRTNNRFRDLSTRQSDGGQTAYVGSMKSDKFARVYRYFEPHPRYEFLRVEMVYRREQARNAGAYLADHGTRDAVIAAGNYYGWQHPLWVDAQTHNEELSAWRPDRPKPDSVRWLLKQVFPAIHRLEREGAIENAWQFVSEHFEKESVDIDG